MSKKILIIRFSSIGDIVLTTPVIRCLRLQLHAEIHFLTKPAYADIVIANPYVSKVILVNDLFETMVMMLKSEKYDFIIDLHHNLRSGRIKLALKCPSASFPKLNIEKWLMVNFKINKLPDLHIVDRYLETVKSLGVVNDGKGLDFSIPREKSVDVENSVGVLPHQYAVIVIGAAHATKCMTADQIAELSDMLELPVVLLGGKQEISKAEEIISKSRNSNIKSACGRFDIFQSASILQQAACMITHDTGLMHIAAALQKSLVVVWGNTIPEFGMYPYYGDKQVQKSWHSFEIKIGCRPCSKLGYSKCPKGHFRCMLNHDVKAIAEEAMIEAVAKAEQKDLG